MSHNRKSNTYSEPDSLPSNLDFEEAIVITDDDVDMRFDVQARRTQTQEMQDKINRGMSAVDELMALATQGESKYPEVIMLPIRPHTPIESADDDEKTTRSDLDILNNCLDACHSKLGMAATTAEVCMLSAASIKLVEARRRVKKLDYGKPEQSRMPMKRFEFLE